MTGHVWLAGAGPGDPGLITVAARDALASAEVVLHDALIDSATLAVCPDGCEIVDVGKRAGRHSATQTEINELIVSHARAGKRVVRLKGGDPFTFGRGSEEALACIEAGIPFTVLPGVSSALAGPALAGIPVTHRGLSSMVTFVTATEAEAGPPVDWRAAAASHTLVVLMGAARAGEVAARLLEAGKAPETPVACVESASMQGQRTIRSSLGRLEADARAACLASPAIIIVGEVVPLADAMATQGPGPLSGRSVAVTRPETTPADGLETILRARGARVIHAPAVAIRPCPEELTTDERASSRWDWIVFTSANAVDVFFDAFAAAGRDARALGGTLVAAIGPATAAALQRHGVRADFLPPVASAASLAAELPRVQGARILLPLSKLASSELESGLRRRGAHVERVDIYETVPAPLPAAALEALLSAHAVTFASPSAVRALAAALGGSTPRGRLVSIGSTTSASVREAFGRVDAEASERSAEGLARAVEEALRWGS